MFSARACMLVGFLALPTLSGCGSNQREQVSANNGRRAGVAGNSRSAAEQKKSFSVRPQEQKQKQEKSRKPRRDNPARKKHTTLADDVKLARQNAERPNLPRPRLLNDARLQAAGVRKLTGKHLALYTDVPSSPAVDELPQVWDQAYPQWCEYFHIDKDQDPPWRMQGFLMKDEASRKKFRAMGLIPDQVPRGFENGYAFNHEFWFFEQKSDYYRRHLMLHEGTHGFMMTQISHCTSPWYSEAMAELFGSHLWKNNKLALRHFPGSREATPYHGRIKLVKEAAAKKKALYIDRVVALNVRPHRVESRPAPMNDGAPDDRRYNSAYAWCWSSAAFLDGHRRYQKRFRSLYRQMATPGLPGVFRELYRKDAVELAEEWQVYVSGIEYGYDIERNEIEFKLGKPIGENEAAVSVRADRGWQSGEIRLQAGVTYALEASGRYVIATKPKPWECGPGGVTIRYYQGLPLGILLAAVRIDGAERERLAQENSEALKVSRFLRPYIVGRSQKITPQFTGTLYFKINDSPAELADNSGTLEVLVKTAAAND